MCVGAEDCLILVYDTASNFCIFRRFKGLQSPATHIDYAEDSKAIRANTKHKVFSFVLEPGEEATKLEEKQWATWSCPLTWALAGVWRAGCTSSDCGGSVAAAGEVQGSVKLFRFPAGAEAGFQEFKGHSGEVSNVMFSCNKRHLISLGGSDKSVFQWRLEAREVEKDEVAEENVVIDEPSVPPEDDPVKRTPKKRQVEPGILEIKEIKQTEEVLLNKPYQAEVLNSTPSAYKEPKDPVHPVTP